jgi:hypothetical protein
VIKNNNIENWASFSSGWSVKPTNEESAISIAGILHQLINYTLFIFTTFEVN